MLKDIRRILAEVEIDQSKFASVYKAGNGQDQPYFELPFRETNLIISGYSAKHRLAIIDRWQELEKPLSTMEMIARTAMAQHEANVKLESMQTQIDEIKAKSMTLLDRDGLTRSKGNGSSLTKNRCKWRFLGRLTEFWARDQNLPQCLFSSKLKHWSVGLREMFRFSI